MQAIKTILLKLSGEALQGNALQGNALQNTDSPDKQQNIDAKMLLHIVNITRHLQTLNIKLAMVVGGGNFLRGQTWQGKHQSSQIIADQMGMLATTINAMALLDTFNQHNIKANVVSGVEINNGICQSFDYETINKKIQNDTVVIFAAGTGNPCFTTDTAAVLRGIEINADLVAKATKVDGIYSDDPIKNPKATRFTSLSYDEVISKQLMVMDMTAFSLAEKHKMPICVFDLFAPEDTLMRIIKGEPLATFVGEEKC